MPRRLNNLSGRPTHFADLSDVLCVTNGADVPHYVELDSGVSGTLGFSSWSNHWDKPTGTLGSGTPDKYYSIVVVPVNDRITFGASFKLGNPTQAAVPVQAENGAEDIDWTIPVHPQTQNVVVGTHTGADAASTLTDSTQSMADDILIGDEVFNLTDGSSGTVTDNDGTTVTATLSGGTDNDWDTGDEYQVRRSEATIRYIYASRGDTAADAAAGPFYFQESIADNTTTAWTQTSYTASTGLLDDTRLPPPNGSFCMSAFGRMWIAGGLTESRGEATLNVDTSEDLTSAAVTITVQTSFSGSTVGQIMRITRDSGSWDTDKLYIGAYLTIEGDGGGSEIAAANELTDARVLYVASDGTYIDVLNESGSAEASKTADLTFALNFITGNTSGGNQTYFDEGFVGSKITFDDDDTTYTIAWVDADNQKLGLTSKYVGGLGGTSSTFFLRNDTKVSYSVVNDPGHHPAENYVDVPDFVTALAQIGRTVIVFGEESIVKFSSDEPQQGLSSILSTKGCPAPYSVIETSRGIVFYDGEGVSRTDGVHVRSLTENRVDDLMKGINRTYEHNIRAVYNSKEEYVEVFFPYGSEVTNDTSTILRLSSGDAYPCRRKDVNAVWQERDSNGEWKTYHGTSTRHTSSGKSYVWEHDEDLGNDYVPGTEGDDDFVGDVTAVDNIGSNEIEVRAARLGFSIGDANTDPYLLEGLTALVRSVSGNSELYPVIEGAALVTPYKEGNALYRGDSVTDDGKTLFTGTDNLNATGIAAESNPLYTRENLFNEKRIYNVTDSSEGVIHAHTLCEFTVKCGSGSHTASSSSSTVLTDSTLARWGFGTNDLDSKIIYNLSDGSSATISAGGVDTGAGTITFGALAGGINNVFSTGDEWIVYGLWGGTDDTWAGGSAGVVGDEYQIGKRYDVTFSSDYDVSDMAVGHMFFLGVVPVTFGPKWLDFGSSHLKHYIKRIHVDVEPQSGGNWLVLEHYKDSNPLPVEVREAYVDANETKAVFPMTEGKCYTYGYRLTCFGRNKLNVHTITPEFSSLQ